MLDNKKLCEIDNGMLSRMRNGTRYTALGWSKLLDLLVLPKAPDATVFVKDPQRVSPCWAVTICKPMDNSVANYCVGPATGERNDLVHIANMFGVEKHTLHSIYEQETSTPDTTHVPSQDAILLDMLLDLIAGDFVPHQHQTNDGLTFQLEILEALEMAQKDAAEATVTAQAPTPSSGESNKKRVSMTDRLKNKKIKVEL